MSTRKRDFGILSTGIYEVTVWLFEISFGYYRSYWPFHQDGNIMKHEHLQRVFYLTTKVQFHTLSTVVAVETQGLYNQYVSSYRLAYSLDCVTFNDLVDVSGTNAVRPLCNH